MAEVLVRESEIEDIFVAHPDILAAILGWGDSFSLVARQKGVQSGRLDLLFVSRNQLFLIELKIEPFEPAFLEQIVGYRDDLLELQRNDGLVSGNLNPWLLVTEYEHRHLEQCENQGVELASYNPEEVLRAFYDRMAGLSDFFTVRPKDYGVWHIGVIGRVVYSLLTFHTIPEISRVIGIATNTTRNHLRFAQQLGLADRIGDKYLLTNLGMEFVRTRDTSQSEFVLSESQTQLLREKIIEDPFASNIVFGIYSLVETVFTLARNSYPVSLNNEIVPFFRESVGKRYDWQTDRSAFLGANAFSNFAVELGLIAKVGDKLFLTPAGFRFILMLQLHKGIRIVDSLGLGIEK